MKTTCENNLQETFGCWRCSGYIAAPITPPIHAQVSVTYIGSKNIGNKKYPFTPTQGIKEIYHANIKEQQEPVS
jgi:hypothetical protein